MYFKTDSRFELWMSICFQDTNSFVFLNYEQIERLIY